MASKSILEKDELIIRAARQRGVSPEKFIKDVRRLSSDRGMCAHSKEYFFRADNVRTLSEAARPFAPVSAEYVDPRERSFLEVFHKLTEVGEDLDFGDFHDVEIARYLSELLLGREVFPGCCDKEGLLRKIERARATSLVLSTFVSLVASRYAVLCGVSTLEKAREEVKEIIEKMKDRRSVIAEEGEKK